MNAPLLNQDDIADARENVYRLLQSVAHYCACAQLHLEVADDPVTLYDIQALSEYYNAAIREFEPVRAAMRQRAGKPGCAK